MRVLKVIVDELPEACRKCDLMVGILPFCCHQVRTEDLHHKPIGDITTRPDWCPLVENGEDLIDWVFDRHGTPVNIDEHLYGKESEE